LRMPNFNASGDTPTLHQWVLSLVISTAFPTFVSMFIQSRNGAQIVKSALVIFLQTQKGR